MSSPTSATSWRILPDLARFLPTLENWETELGGGGLDMYCDVICEDEKRESALNEDDIELK
jgi:hypothetical protein